MSKSISPTIIPSAGSANAAAMKSENLRNADIGSCQISPAGAFFLMLRRTFNLMSSHSRTSRSIDLLFDTHVPCHWLIDIYPAYNHSWATTVNFTDMPFLHGRNLAKFEFRQGGCFEGVCSCADGNIRNAASNKQS
jgi:hypothetical protein